MKKVYLQQKSFVLVVLFFCQEFNWSLSQVSHLQATSQSNQTFKIVMPELLVSQTCRGNKILTGNMVKSDLPQNANMLDKKRRHWDKTLIRRNVPWEQPNAEDQDLINLTVLTKFLWNITNPVYSNITPHAVIHELLLSVLSWLVHIRHLPWWTEKAKQCKICRDPPASFQCINKISVCEYLGVPRFKWTEQCILFTHALQKWSSCKHKIVSFMCYWSLQLSIQKRRVICVAQTQKVEV